MRTEQVEFFSDGVRLRGLLRLPDRADEPVPGIVHGPGWLGTGRLPELRALAPGPDRHGYAVLAFDYRGFGSSEGERGWVRPSGSSKTSSAP